MAEPRRARRVQAMLINGLFEQVHVLVAPSHQDHTKVVVIDSEQFIQEDGPAQGLDERNFGIDIGDFGRKIPKLHHACLLRSRQGE